MNKNMLSHLILTATLFVGNVGMVNAPIQSNYDNSETDPIVMILNQYSDFLFKGETGRSTVFTQEIQELISDRRSFYKDFLEIGLNIQFSSIDSKYLPIESTNLIKNDGGYELIVFEEITLHGNSMITTVEAYPLVQSAKWAINNTDNSAVLIALNDYLTSMEESVSNSLNEDIQIHLVLKHEMTFTEGRDNLLLIKDSFDDKSIENVDGTDVVVWKDEGFVRIKPDWTKFPDYQFFNTPIEELGKQLLLEYTSIYGENLSKSEGFISSFDHSSAAQYARSYTSNTTSVCLGGSALQDASKYNTNYNYYNCVDCANYVSQALRYGGYSTDSTWSPYTTAWINSVSLKNYLVSTGKVVFVTSIANLQVGDIAWTGDLGHVVVYTATNPARGTVVIQTAV